MVPVTTPPLFLRQKSWNDTGGSAGNLAGGKMKKMDVATWDPAKVFGYLGVGAGEGELAMSMKNK